ncbi:MAG: hypothetical protein M1833_005238 [Piccolia ochrophora]|nr:MAG: hypothetical protein M1833_005238 [Piccolia ochrophora]
MSSWTLPDGNSAAGQHGTHTVQQTMQTGQQGTQPGQQGMQTSSHYLDERTLQTFENAYQNGGMNPSDPAARVAQAQRNIDRHAIAFRQYQQTGNHDSFRRAINDDGSLTQEEVAHLLQSPSTETPLERYTLVDRANEPWPARSPEFTNAAFIGVENIGSSTGNNAALARGKSHASAQGQNWEEDQSGGASHRSKANKKRSRKHSSKN